MTRSALDPAVLEPCDGEGMQDIAPLRVLALMDSRILSGPGRQLGAVAQALQAHRVALLVVLPRRRGRPSSPLVQHLISLGVECTEIPEAFPFDPMLVVRVRSLIRRWAPNIVQTHGYKPTTVMAALRALGVRTPWIGFFHGATSENARVRAYNALDRRLLRRADQLVVVARSQIGHFPRSPRVLVMDNAVLSPAQPRRPAHTAQRRWRLGVAGRLSPEKGVDLLLDAAVQLRNDGFPFALVVAGDGPEAGALRSRAAESGLDGLVEFRGTVRDMSSFYSDIDALVIPSRSEGLPNVLLEGLAAGLPVIATAVGAVPDVLGRSAAGTLVAPGDSGALADACHRVALLAADPDREAARLAILKRFSLERRVAEHLLLYSEVLKRSSEADGN